MRSYVTESTEWSVGFFHRPPPILAQPTAFWSAHSDHQHSVTRFAMAATRSVKIVLPTWLYVSRAHLGLSRSAPSATMARIDLRLPRYSVLTQSSITCILNSYIARATEFTLPTRPPLSPSCKDYRRDHGWLREKVLGRYHPYISPRPATRRSMRNAPAAKL